MLSSGADPPENRIVDERTSTEIYQKILSIPSQSSDESILNPVSASPQQNLATYSSTFNYETSFQYGKHSMIKNIKFKVPEQYTNLFKQSSNKGTNNNSGDSNDVNESSDTGVFSELKPVANASVIVNNSNLNQSSDIHWRRRTSQNLVLKN